VRPVLLNPGPVSLSEGVRRAAVKADFCHRETEFFELQDRLRLELPRVYGLDVADWAAVMLGGSGTTALEAMMTSLVPPDARLLILENGVYGERLTRLTEIYGISHGVVQHGWKESWDFNQIEAQLHNGEFTHVAAVHHETTTGRLNPVAELAGLCERYHVDLLLDTVSSYGAENIPFESVALQACAITANKCLHGITGLCVVIARVESLRNCVDPPRTLTLNLGLWADHQGRQSTPFTPSVNAMMALDQSLIELAEDGGWKARHARYLKLADRVARQLAALGIEPMLPATKSSCVLRSYRIPPGSNYQTIHDGLKQRGFIIYAGQGKLSEEMFRISTMGDISDYDLGRLLAALESVFQ